jgi:IS30 family transposase
VFGEGIVDPEQIRLTVSARKVTVVKLHEQGFSQRQIAKVVGANQKTVGRDLTEANSSKSEEKSSPKPKPPKPNPVREIETPLDELFLIFDLAIYGRFKLSQGLA